MQAIYDPESQTFSATLTRREYLVLAAIFTGVLTENAPPELREQAESLVDDTMAGLLTMPDSGDDFLRENRPALEAELAHNRQVHAERLADLVARRQTPVADPEEA